MSVAIIKTNIILNHLHTIETYDKTFGSVMNVSAFAGSNMTSVSCAASIEEHSCRVSSSSRSRRGLFDEVLSCVEVISVPTAV